MKSLLYAMLGLAVIQTARVNAQSFSVLHSFVFPAEAPNSPLVQDATGAWYGTTPAGGTGGFGTVFKVDSDGTGFTNLYNFQNALDGGTPVAGLVLTNGLLFGAATTGGAGGNGTIFVVGTNGTGFNLVWSFTAGATSASGLLTNADGGDPEAGLIFSGGNLYGTAYGAGPSGVGTVFSLPTNGSYLAVLHAFSAGADNADGALTNSDGANPEAGLALAGTNLFGAAYNGGVNGNGTLFRLGTNGNGFTVLKTFSPLDTVYGTNADGANPFAGLVLAGTNLFGTTENGGTSSGLVFALATNGSSFRVLKYFSATDPNTGTNTDGAFPVGTLVLSGTNLFGTTEGGGFWDDGTVFMVSTNGKSFANFHNFAEGSDGAEPLAGLALSGTNLFGTASAGGAWDAGTLFRLNTKGAGFTNFYIFDGTDGVTPLGGLVLSGGMYYGMTSAGGSANDGMVFKISTNGGSFSVLKNFSATDPVTGTNVDGAYPQGNLVLAGGTLFGTATSGGRGADGTVFALGTNGAFNVLWNFTASQYNSAGLLTNHDGVDPEAGLVLSGSALFGTTYNGGTAGNGTVFTLPTNGNPLVVLHTFSSGNDNASGAFTNADGANPEAGLVTAGTNLYGAAYNGGINGNGTLFRLGTNGGGFTVLKPFSPLNTVSGTNTDGAYPYTDLLLVGTTLFGTAENGGSGGSGTVFAISTNGTGFRVLEYFSATDPDTGTNTDGADPDGGLVLSSNLLFGTTSEGGFWSGGTIYEVNTNGSAFACLHHFYPPTDGAGAHSDLLLSGNVLSGTASEGGNGGGGTVFDLNTTVVSPFLGILGTGTAATIFWPSPSVGFSLEQNAGLVASNWVVFPGTVSDDGFVKTAAIGPLTGNLFFRLYHP